MNTRRSDCRRWVFGAAALLGLMAVAVPGSGQTAPIRIYIAPDDHTDYMWSADEETYRRAFVGMIDYYLDLADLTQHNPSEYQSRWNCDGTYWLWEYAKSKSTADFARLIRRIRDGHISVPLNALNSTYGATPTEAVLRGMYYAGKLERRYALRFPIAVAMENQTLPFGLGALWAGSGAKYSWRGICGCASLLETKAVQRRPHEVYWWQGQDGSRILMKWNTLSGDNKSIGGYAEARDPGRSIDFVTSDPKFTSIYPYRVIGVFGKGWDDLQTLTDEFVTAARTKTDPSRKVIVSNQLDFFQDFEATYGRDLPVYSASFGNEWDLYSASLAEVSAQVRRSVERLRTAEALATLVSLKQPEFLKGRESDRDQAWMNLGLYWEHGWTGDSPVLRRDARAAWQRKLSNQIASYVDSLRTDAAFVLGGLIRKTGSNLRFYAFNPLGWVRSDFVDLPFEGETAVRVIDLTSGAEVPSQFVRLNTHVYLKGQRYLRIWAQGVPALGYKVFEIRQGAGVKLLTQLAASGDVIENSAYRIRLDGRGAITSLVDKERGNHEFALALGTWGINDLGPGHGTLEVENAGPVSVTLKATSAGPIHHTTRVTLFRDSRRIDIQNEITQNFNDVQSWRFAFNLASPDVWHEEVGAVLRARLVPDGGHYAATNARLDWLTLNHFVSMTGDGDMGITLSNADCAFMRLGESSTAAGISKLDTSTPRISVLAGGQVDGPDLGIPQQGGDAFFTQRFALETRGPFAARDAMKFALEHQNPLVAGSVTGGNFYPASTFSLLSISDPDVLLWALKPAEDGLGNGLIARVWNLAAEKRRFSISLPDGIARAWDVTHIETDISRTAVVNGRLTSDAAPSQLKTFRFLTPAMLERLDAVNVRSRDLKRQK